MFVLGVLKDRFHQLLSAFLAARDSGLAMSYGHKTSGRNGSRVCENTVSRRRCKNPASPEACRATIGIQVGVSVPLNFYLF